MRGEQGYAVCVGGIPGVGKTLLLKTHVQEYEPRDRQITGSSVVKAIIAPATVVDLDGWPAGRRKAVREESIRRLRVERSGTEGRLLVDGHFTLRNRMTGAIEPIFTDEDRSFFDALALVEAPPEQVLSWRRSDRRDRGNESLAEIEAHLVAEREEGCRVATEMGVPWFVVSHVDLSVRRDELRAFLAGHASLA